MNNIINEINNINDLKIIFKEKNILRINNFLKEEFSESLFKYALSEKNWLISSGIDKNKYEKKDILQYQKANLLQIKNVNSAFGNDHFSYIFYRSMNGVNMPYLEFSLRQYLNSDQFINTLNEITGLHLKKLTTLFLSRYKTGNFLSPHSDKGNGRLAFVINLTKFWKPQYGGLLHFMNSERTEIIDTFVPAFNTFLIFYVPETTGIPHFVSHISPNVKFSRYSITGWFD